MQIFPRALLLMLASMAVVPASYAGLFISVNIAPPALPVYEQPPVPAPGYIWTPGYWAYAEDGGYYWVPGTWVMAPQPNYLWTPGYWGWSNSVYVWHPGYWGPHVGFYGGVNYGYGYGGSGYEGGRWDHGVFNYNTAVNNVNVSTIHNTYNTTVINNVTRVSYNGGSGGVEARPSAREQAFEREPHLQATSLQANHEQAARSNPELRAANNGGHPSIAATPRPGAFSGPGVVRARAESEAAAPRGEPAPPATAMHAPAGSAQPHRPPPRPAGPQLQQPAPAPHPPHENVPRPPPHENAPHPAPRPEPHEHR